MQILYGVAATFRATQKIADASVNTKVADVTAPLEIARPILSALLLIVSVAVAWILSLFFIVAFIPEAQTFNR